MKTIEQQAMSDVLSDALDYEWWMERLADYSELQVALCKWLVGDPADLDAVKRDIIEAESLQRTAEVEQERADAAADYWAEERVRRWPQFGGDWR